MDRDYTRQAATTSTEDAPATRRAAAHAPAVAPVVTRSSTSTILPGEGSEANAPCRFTIRSARVNPAWSAVAPDRRKRRTNGRPVRRDTPSARTSAWSKPRWRTSRRLPGTNVTLVPTTPRRWISRTIASTSGRAASRLALSFNPRTNERAAPSYAHGQRTRSTPSGTGPPGEGATSETHTSHSTSPKPPQPAQRAPLNMSRTLMPHDASGTL